MIKNSSSIPSFLAGDLTQIKELLHPGNDGLQIPFSVALAALEPGGSSLPHRLVKSCEVYYITGGHGRMYLDNVSKEVEPGDLVFIKPNALQHIENTSDGQLTFLCIVAPPWSADDEVIL